MKLQYINLYETVLYNINILNKSISITIINNNNINNYIDASVLPTLELSDISKNIKRIDLSHEIIDKCPTQVRKTATNGISYFGALRIIEDFPDELRPYLPIYCKVM